MRVRVVVLLANGEWERCVGGRSDFPCGQDGSLRVGTREYPEAARGSERARTV